MDRTSDTCSQGYTDMQSLAKCLNHRHTVCSQARLCYTARCVDMHEHAFNVLQDIPAGLNLPKKHMLAMQNLSDQIL